ncbi:glycosyl hydrolase family 28-related protein [Pantoea ananatis]|uniref:glycosyl hydrolase family 28-related protein n=1 Tax=Pantoea ananas TaxID=553 RepID=UPI001B3058FE|nr:glycosyl hydrolase family 28-related protein [Pantoea ananatis]
MTVSTIVNHEQYEGNGTATTFPYRFRVLKDSHMIVTVSDLSGNLIVLRQGVDYDITGVGNVSGGSVILRSPLQKGYSISLDRDLPAVQETDLRNQGRFFAETHEDAFDYLTMLVQKVSSFFTRALKKPSFIAKYYDAEGNQISNLGDPANDLDAVNNRSLRNYVEKAVAGVTGGFGWFIQYGVGAIYRTFQDKLRDIKSVKDFGAKGDGVTDDSDAIQLAANSGCLYFPPGTYLVSKDIVLTVTKDCVIKGSSRADTSITYTGTGTLFSAKFPDSIRFVQVSEIRVMTNTLAKATAFYFEWPEDFEHGLVQRGSFFNVSIRGVDEYENGFNSCVHMHQGDNINFINCEFKGAGGSTTVTQAYNTRCAIGVNITGRFSPVEYRFSNCYFGSFYQGIKVEDTAEGIYISNCILLNVRHALYWVTGLWSPNWPDNPGSSAAGRPFLSIHNSHLSFYEYGVYTSGVICIHETDILTYHHQSATQNGISFAHGNATEVSIVCCEAWGFNTTYYVDGVDFYQNVTYSKVKDLRFVAAANNSARYAVQLRPGCTNNDIYGVMRRKSGGTFVNGVTINELPGGLNNIGIRGGLFYATATQNVASGLSTVINYGARDYDPDNLWQGSGGSITIPAGVSRIRLSGAALLDSATTASTRELFFLNNGAAARGMGQQSSTSVVGKGTYMNITSGVILVTPGDVITMNVRHDDGQTRTLQANLTWLQVEIIS